MTETRAVYGAKRRRAPEKAVQREIVRALDMFGCFVSDLSQPRSTFQTPGLPDLHWCQPEWGLSGWIEVKAPGGRVRPAQETWISVVRRSGERVWVLHSVTELVAALREAGAPIE